MPELGRGMLFPRSYFADQFSPAQEEAMEAAQAAAEDVGPDLLEAFEMLGQLASMPSDRPDADEEAA